MLTDFQTLAEQTILSQYSTSPHIKGLVYAFKDAIDPTEEIQQFYDYIFNAVFSDKLASECKYGLNIWGVIVATTRYLSITTDPAFGYKLQTHVTGETAWQPFDQNAPFRYDNGQQAGYTELEPEAWRTMLRTKMSANISDGTLPSLKKFVRMIFLDADGNEDMRNTVFNNGLMAVRFILCNQSASRIAIFKSLAPFVIGAGVGIDYGIFPENYIGFAGTDAVPFGQGTFNTIGFTSI